jgi:hypothetical protein
MGVTLMAGVGVGGGGVKVADTVTVGVVPLKGLEQPETSMADTSMVPTINAVAIVGLIGETTI